MFELQSNYHLQRSMAQSGLGFGSPWSPEIEILEAVAA
jgi:hypothetical protein